MTTNLPFDEWTEVFGSERLTGALLDRLTHRVHILEMNGESYRLRESRRAISLSTTDSDNTRNCSSVSVQRDQLQRTNKPSSH